MCGFTDTPVNSAAVKIPQVKNRDNATTVFSMIGIVLS